MKTQGLTLVELLVGSMLGAFFVLLVARGYQFFLSSLTHALRRSEIAGIRDDLRRRTDCSQTLTIASCDGLNPIRVISKNGSVIVEIPPGETAWGGWKLKATCLNSIQVVATATGLVKAPLKPTMQIFGDNDGFCGRFVSSGASPSTLLTSALVNTDIPCAKGESRIYSQTLTCPAGYYVVGGGGDCSFPSSADLAPPPASCNSANLRRGGYTLESHPFSDAGGQSGWQIKCCSAFDTVGGCPTIPQTAYVSCFKQSLSGGLDNE